MGIQLVKGKNIYGTMDLYNGPTIIYICKTLSDEEKLAAVSYLYLAACYK